MKKVLVAGATGYLGRFVVKEFKKRDYWIRALARNQEKLEKEGTFLEPDVKEKIDEIFVGEVTKAETLSALRDGIYGAGVALVFVNAAEESEKEIAVGGLDTISYIEIPELIFSGLAKPKKITKIAIWVDKLAVNLIQPFSKHYHTIASFFTTGMQNDFDAQKVGHRSLKSYFETLISQH